MNQQDLADAVAKAIGVDKAEAAKAVAAVLDTIRDSLKRGEKIAIGGFGSFETMHREARPGRNLKTGEVVEIPAGIVIKFKPVKGLKDAVNGGSQGVVGNP
jgi:DNA-binding protein HU-beta